jgi:hypothetical protein
MSPFNTPGPKPGSKGAVKQHHAMASGYELPKPKRVVKTFQRESETGCVYTPGLTNCGTKKRK